MFIFCLEANDERVTPVIEDGKVTGIKIGGADTVYPFKKNKEPLVFTVNQGNYSGSDATTFGIDLTDYNLLTYTGEGLMIMSTNRYHTGTVANYYPTSSKKYIDISTYTGNWYFSSNPTSSYYWYYTVTLE